MIHLDISTLQKDPSRFFPTPQTFLTALPANPCPTPCCRGGSYKGYTEYFANPKRLGPPSLAFRVSESLGRGRGAMEHFKAVQYLSCSHYSAVAVQAIFLKCHYSVIQGGAELRFQHNGMI
jgi:hypothetical protein